MTKRINIDELEGDVSISGTIGYGTDGYQTEKIENRKSPDPPAFAGNPLRSSTIY